MKSLNSVNFNWGCIWFRLALKMVRVMRWWAGHLKKPKKVNGKVLSKAIGFVKNSLVKAKNKVSNLASEVFGFGGIVGARCFAV